LSTIDKALSVLELFSESRPSIGLSEASRLLRRDKATVQRYLTVLNERGFLDQDALTRAYHLGPAVTRLSLVRDLTYPVNTGVRNVLRKLVADTGETAHASHSQKNGELSVVAIAETSFKGTRVYIDPAAFLPLHASASGIAFLSALSEDTATELLVRPLETFTPSTAKDRKEVLKLVHQARERGYAKMAGTLETDVVGMAVADGIVVHGVITDDQVETMGINDRRQLAEAERALQKRLVDQLMDQGVTFADPDRVDIRGNLSCGTDVFIDVNAIFEGDVSLGDNVKVESNNVIRDSQVGSGTLIRPNCHIDGATTGSDCTIGPFARLRPGAELSNNVGIGNYVEIKKSTIAAGSKVNHLSYIGDSIVGRDVNIGAGTITCNYDGLNKHQTIIGDGTFIGSGVELVAPVEIGKGATIGAGSTISRPAPAGKLTLERTKQVTVVSWKAPTKRK